MLAEPLIDRAVLYVSGAMAAPERESFEVILEFHQELRAQVAALQEAVAAMTLTQGKHSAVPPSGLKARLLEAVDTLPPKAEPEAMVATTPDGLVEWVNPAFTALCGFSLDELKGRKPGHLLQGPGTDPAAVDRIRESLRARRACRETLVNYHKDGSRYRAEVRISPVLDDDGQPLWFVARERRISEEVGSSA